MMSQKRSNAEIISLINSKALEHFISSLPDFVKHQRDRNRLIDFYARLVTESFSYVKLLEEQREKQLAYLERLDQVCNKLSTIESLPNDASMLLDASRVKKHLAQHESNLSKNSAIEYEKYWIVHLCDEFFRYLKFEKRMELISNIFIYFNEASAICGEAKAKIGVYRYHPSGYCEWHVIVSSDRIKAKPCPTHKECEEFKRLDNNCCGEICSRELEAVAQRRKRAKTLFRNKFNSEEYIQFSKELFPKNKISQDRRNGGLLHIYSRKSMNNRIRNRYILKQLRRIMLNKFNNLYLTPDKLTSILNRNRISKKKFAPIYSDIANDKEFLELFKVIFPSRTN